MHALLDIMYCDLMILRMFRILTFVKSDYTPFFHFASFDVCIFFLSFKKRQLMEFFLIHIYRLSARLFTQLSTRFSAQLSAWLSEASQSD